MNGPIHHFDVRNEDLLSYDAQGVAELFSCPAASVAFGRVPPGSVGMQGIAAEGCEDNAVVLSGLLSYPTEPGKELFAARGAWVVARPGEIQGYCNRSAKSVTLFIFRPRVPGGTLEGRTGTRVFVPASPQAVPRVTAYETPASRGEVLALHPGGNAALGPAAVRAALVTAGRVMALSGREKVSLDVGEGLAFVGIPVEFVGVGGLSAVAVFSTAR